MQAVRFIAGRLERRGHDSGEEKDALSGIGRNIAWISVALSILIMIVAISVTLGFRKAIRARATGFMGSLVMVVPGQGPMNEQYPFNCNLSYLGALDSLEGVMSVCPVAVRSGMVKSDNGIAGLYFKGVDSLYDFSFYAESLVAGELPSFSGRIGSDALISERLASQMGLGVGDKMVSYFVGDELKVRSFRICGLFDARLEDVDKSFALVDIRQVRRISSWSADDVSALEIRISPDAGIDRLKNAVEEIEYSRSGEEDDALFVLSVKTICANLFDWLSLLDLNVVMILLLMTVVASFNMISAVLIILFRRISMIGILKSLGMPDGNITRVFLLKSAGIVGKGILVGNAVAIALCLVQKHFNIIELDPANYFVSSVPISLSAGWVIIVDISAFALIMAALSLCSIFVARVSPDRTMRVD